MLRVKVEVLPIGFFFTTKLKNPYNTSVQMKYNFYIVHS